MDTKASRTTQLARYYRVLFQEENIRYAVIESKERKYGPWLFLRCFLALYKEYTSFDFQNSYKLEHFCKAHGWLHTSGIILDSGQTSTLFDSGGGVKIARLGC